MMPKTKGNSGAGSAAPSSVWKDHPLVTHIAVGSVVVLAAIGIGVPLHNMVIEQKNAVVEQRDAVIGNKQATIERLEKENEEMRRRLSGEVVLVSTQDVQNLEARLGLVGSNVAENLRAVQDAFAELKAIRAEVGKVSGEAKVQEDYGRLREVANIRPSGEQVNWLSGNRGGTGMASHGPSAIAEKLNSAFLAMNSNDLHSAARLLHEITVEIPQWPYAYFYEGLTRVGSFDYGTNSFQQAAERFGQMRQAGINEPELVLFEAMNDTFLSKFNEANGALDKLSEIKIRAERVPILAISAKTPEPLRKRFEQLAEDYKQRLQTFVQ